jgi:hypothetical protein
MIQLKWSNGSINERSIKRVVIVKEDNVSNTEYNKVIDNGGLELGTINDFNHIGENLYYNEGQNKPDIRQGINGGHLNKEVFTQRTKHREEQNEKLSNRHMVIQKNINPFVTNGNYIDHLNTEDEFLRPKDSNYN